MVVAVTHADALAVTAAAAATALATGLGALPLVFARRPNRVWLGVANIIAAALMTGASAMLFYKGAQSDVLKTFVGVVVGIATISFAARRLACAKAGASATSRGPRPELR